MPTISPRYGTELRYASRISLFFQRASSRVAVTAWPSFWPTLRPPRGRAQAVVDQAGELHRQGRRAARSRVPDVAPGARRHRLPVDAAVLPEAPVLAQHDRRQQGRRHLGERRPGEPAHRLVDANGLDRRAVAVDEREVGRPMRRLDLGERRQRVGRPCTTAARRATRSAASARRHRASARRAPRSSACATSRHGATSMPGVRRLAEAFRRVHRLDPRRRQREAARIVEADRVLDDVLAARQVLVIAAKRLEAALLERRPGVAARASRRASRSASRGRGRCRGSSRRPAPDR